eukprot:4573617-Prymnesium_polylepis.1
MPSEGCRACRTGSHWELHRAAGHAPERRSASRRSATGADQRASVPTEPTGACRGAQLAAARATARGIASRAGAAEC